MQMIIATHLTWIHREILEGMVARPGPRHSYLIKPAGLEARADYPGLTVLDGGFDDIPLKDESLDALIAVDIQDALNLKRSCREFRRALKSRGVVFGWAPFMGLGGTTDPLGVGEVMKKMKWCWSGSPNL